MVPFLLLLLKLTPSPPFQSGQSNVSPCLQDYHNHIFSFFQGIQLSKHHHLHHLCSKNCSACYNLAVIMLSSFCDNRDSGAFHWLKTQLYNCHHKYDNDHQQHKFCNKHQYYDNHLHCHNTSNIEPL